MSFKTGAFELMDFIICLSLEKPRNSWRLKEKKR